MMIKGPSIEPHRRFISKYCEDNNRKPKQELTNMLIFYNLLIEDFNLEELTIEKIKDTL